MRAQERLQLYAIQCLLRVIFLNGQHPTAKTFTGCRCRLYLLWVKVWVVAETSTYLFHYWHWYVILQQNHCTNFIRKIHNQVFKWRTPIINGYVLPVVMKSLFHGTGSVPTWTSGICRSSLAGPTVWNSLPEDTRDPDVSEDSYTGSLKTFLFSQY